jgi:hypothetical protein
MNVHAEKLQIAVLMTVKNVHLLSVVVTVEAIQIFQIGDSTIQVKVVIASHVQVVHVVIKILRHVQAIHHTV